MKLILICVVLLITGSVYSSVPPIYTLYIDVDDNQFQTMISNGTQEDHYPCNVTLMGTLYTGVTINVHADDWVLFPKKSFELRWLDDSYPRFNVFQYPGDDIFRLTSILLVSSAVDPTFLRQKLMSDTILQLGGLAPRIVFCEVYKNNQYYGFYLFQELIGVDYLITHSWSLNGNLYEADSPFADFQTKTPSTLGYIQITGYPSNDVDALLNTIDSTPMDFSSWEKYVRPFVSITDWFIYNFVQIYGYNTEGFDHSYFMYHDPNGMEPFHFISSDMLSTWGNNKFGSRITPLPTSSISGWDHLSSSLFSIPQYMQSYVINMECLINNGSLQSSLLISNLNTWFGSILPYVQRDFSTWSPIYSNSSNSFGGQFYDNSRTPKVQVLEMIDFITQRESDLLNQLLLSKMSSPDLLLDEWGLPFFECGKIREQNLIQSNETILINEVQRGDLTTTWIELFNPMDTTVDISGWFLTDDLNNKTHTKIPPGSTMPPKGYLSINIPLIFDANQITLYLFSNLGESIDRMTVPATPAGASYGLCTISTGELVGTLFSTPTPGLVNGAPWIGPLVISEMNILAQPGQFQHLVIQSIVDTPTYLNLQGTQFSWLISGIQFIFPNSTVIPPHGTAIILIGNSSVLNFQPLYNIKPDVLVFYAEVGRLSSDGESLIILQPVAPGSPSLFTPIEEIDYSITAPWPMITVGQALLRISNSAFGNDPANWQMKSNTSCNPSWQVCPIAPTPPPSPTVLPPFNPSSPMPLPPFSSNDTGTNTAAHSDNSKDSPQPALWLLIVIGIVSIIVIGIVFVLVLKFGITNHETF